MLYNILNLHRSDRYITRHERKHTVAHPCLISKLELPLSRIMEAITCRTEMHVQVHTINVRDVLYESLVRQFDYLQYLFLV